MLEENESASSTSLRASTLWTDWNARGWTPTVYTVLPGRVLPARKRQFRKSVDVALRNLAKMTEKRKKMYLHICLYNTICMYICILYVCIYIYIYTNIYMYTCVCIYIYICIHVSIYIYTCVCIYIYIFIYLYICIYVYMYTCLQYTRTYRIH